jgi:hypothetical protein
MKSTKRKGKGDLSNVNMKLLNVRLSYAHLFKATSFEDGDEDDRKKFKATFILDKDDHADIIEEIEKTMNKMARAWPAFKGKVPKTLKLCLRDGEEKEDKDGYSDEVMFISASSDKRPVCCHRDPSVAVTEEDDVLYSGCYVNASIRLWVQDNKWGKRINAALRAVQFVRDGEAFGGDQVDASEEFEDLEDMDEDDVL